MVAESDESDQSNKPEALQDAAAPESADALTSPYEDPKADKAVDDILKKDGDEVLKAQDKEADKAVVMKEGFKERFRDFFHGWWSNPRKRYSAIGALILLVLILLGIPYTRYNILGLALNASATVQAVDSKTGSPISGATVKLGGKTAQTDANGKATLKVHGGSKTLVVNKKYYTGYTHAELVAVPGSSGFKATLVATGQQVKVKVTNLVTGNALSGATVSAGGASTKTDTDGMANLVIPSDATVQAATITTSGYNTARVNITAAGDLAKNTFAVTPAGRLYFLSNLSGKIDVVKTNLDGTDRQTVLAGTGNEDSGSTSLLASRDWKYLALLSRRSGDNASVYLIDTTNNDKLTTIDQGNADFSLVGWSGDNFVYQVTRNTISNWQAGQQALKSFDATSGETLLLDQTQASGTDQSNWMGQQFGSPYLMGSQVVYAKNWSSSSSYAAQVSAKQAELDSIGVDGSNHKTVKSFGVAQGTQTDYIAIGTRLYEPDGLYVSFNDGTGDSFYDYDNGSITPDTTLTDTSLYETSYPTYLLSPSGNNTFWSEQRDGKNTLFVGDDDAKNQKQIASLSDYDVYGWYTDNYLLVSKGSSELYIMPVAGGTPIKITDYYKPNINYQGYGGGYGGL